MKTIYFDFTHLSSSPRLNTGIQRVIRELYNSLVLSTSDNSSDFHIVPVSFDLNLDSFVEINVEHIFHDKQGKASSSNISRFTFLGKFRTIISFTRRICKNIVGKVLNRSSFALKLSLVLKAVVRRFFSQLNPSEYSLNPILPNPGDVFLTGDTAWDIADRLWKSISSLKLSGVHICALFYDGLPWIHPEYFDDRAVLLWRSYYLASLKIVDEWFSISSTSSDQLQRIYNDNCIPAPLLRIFPLGSSLTFMDDKCSHNIDFSDRTGHAPSPFLLVVSSLDSRKGYDTLLDSISYISSPINIQIVGRPTGKNASYIMNQIKESRFYQEKIFRYQL